MPLEERRRLLAGIPFRLPVARVRALAGDTPWEHACREGWEGVIAKRRDAPYQAGRSKLWLKMKCEATQELVIGGFTDPQGARVGLGALLVGYFEKADLVFAGKVGTGFNTALLTDLRAAPGRDRADQAPVHCGHRLAKIPSALGPPGSRRPGRVHGMDGAQQASPSSAARRPSRQGRARRGPGAAVITHPDKVLFPDDGITKGELAAYYDHRAAHAPAPAAAPITMERFPAGIGAKGFLQKDVVKGFPAWLKRVEAPKKGGTVHYALAGDRRSLAWLANQNTIAMHVWASRAPRLDRPDVCVFDLDPSREDPDVLRTVVLGLRDLLVELGHPSWVKTSGSKGFHVVVRLAPRATFGDSSRLASHVAGVFVQRFPKLLTQEFSKADRRGRILVDIGRNRAGATFVAAYSLRAKPGAPVSAPCTWEEIEQVAVRRRSVAHDGDARGERGRSVGGAGAAPRCDDICYWLSVIGYCIELLVIGYCLDRGAAFHAQYPITNEQSTNSK